MEISTSKEFLQLQECKADKVDGLTLTNEAMQLPPAVQKLLQTLLDVVYLPQASVSKITVLQTMILVAAFTCVVNATCLVLPVTAQLSQEGKFVQFP